MKGLIRKATVKDLAAQKEIIAEGKATIKELGINMWTGDYPGEEVLLEDIGKGNAYVYCQDGKVVAIFTLDFMVDPVYEKIENGAWLCDQPYSILRRLAVSGTMRGQNITGKIIQAIGIYSMAMGYPSLRLDTHPANVSMKRALEKNGFQYTGELNTDQTWHAYEKVLLAEPTRIQPATVADIPNMMRIINYAKANLKAMGLDQWQRGYPDEAVLEADIAKKDSYLYFEEGQLVAVFALIYGDDPFYHVIENGEWLTNLPYSAIHRVAVAEEVLGTGVMGRIFQHSELLTSMNGYSSIRVDTHPGNQPMQRAITKSGFIYCGTVYVAEGGVRLAYEKPFEADC